MAEKKESLKIVKKEYKTPSLTVYGKISDLTSGGKTAPGEKGGGKKK